MYWPFCAAKDDAPPFEFAFHTPIPQDLHRIAFFDDTDKRYLEHPGADAYLDARHTWECQELVPYLVLLVRPFGSSHSLGKLILVHSIKGTHSQRTGLCWAQRTLTSNFLMTFRTSGGEGGWSTSMGDTVGVKEGFRLLCGTEDAGSASTTSFSTSRMMVNTTPCSDPPRAQETWKAFGHFPLVHCMGAPCVLSLVFEQAEHF